MRLVLRLLAAAVVALGALPLLAGSAWACTCSPPGSDAARYRQAARTAAVIYVGRVTRETHSGGRYRYAVTVDEALKGTPADADVLETDDDPAECGNRLHTGRILVIDRVAGLCDATTQERVAARAALVREELARSTPGPESSPVSLSEGGGGRGPLLPVAAAGAGLVGLAALTLRARRPPGRD